MRLKIIATIVCISVSNFAYAQTCPYDLSCIDNPNGAGSPYAESGINNPYSSAGSSPVQPVTPVSASNRPRENNPATWSPLAIGAYVQAFGEGALVQLERIQARARAAARRRNMSTSGFDEGSGEYYTNGYTRQDGRYVEGYHSTNPNKTETDNWSSEGNINPYTGQEGKRIPR